MKHMMLVALVLCSSLVWSQEGAPIYKSKCAGCHGANAEGKVGPPLKTTNLSESDIVTLLTKGEGDKKAPHKKAMSGLTEDQAKAVAQYVKSLK